MLLRLRSIFRIWNGCGVFISGPMSRTGRMSTWLPGRNATAPARSTMKPPLTRPKMVPLIRSPLLNAVSSTFHASSRRAFSRLRPTKPSLSSKRSIKTSTVSPGASVVSRPGVLNSFNGTRPSDFRPTSMTAMSLLTLTMVPLTTRPTNPPPSPRDSSSNAEKLSLRAGWVSSPVAPEAEAVMSSLFLNSLLIINILPAGCLRRSGRSMIVRRRRRLAASVVRRSSGNVRSRSHTYPKGLRAPTASRAAANTPSGSRSLVSIT